MAGAAKLVVPCAASRSTTFSAEANWGAIRRAISLPFVPTATERFTMGDHTEGPNWLASGRSGQIISDVRGSNCGGELRGGIEGSFHGPPCKGSHYVVM